MSSSTQTAAEAARSFRMAMRLKDTDRLAHELALHQHFDRFVPQHEGRGTCALPHRR